MNLKIQLVKTKKEYKDILEIRKKVFVEEQNVPFNIEIEHEEDSKHVICFIDQLAVGTGRWRKTKNGIKLERFAVLTDFRNKGIGKEIVNFILSEISSNNTIYLHAQEAVVNFYKKLGFKVSGKKFYEADILHSKMIYSLKI
tara:strand:+ start:353 stop:778 length:426 start_codon:yes stop_codon:yes gene_type:complete